RGDVVDRPLRDLAERLGETVEHAADRGADALPVEPVEEVPQLVQEVLDTGSGGGEHPDAVVHQVGEAAGELGEDTLQPLERRLQATVGDQGGDVRAERLTERVHGSGEHVERGRLVGQFEEGPADVGQARLHPLDGGLDVRENTVEQVYALGGGQPGGRLLGQLAHRS